MNEWCDGQGHCTYTRYMDACFMKQIGTTSRRQHHQNSTSFVVESFSIWKIKLIRTRATCRFSDRCVQRMHLNYSCFAFPYSSWSNLPRNHLMQYCRIPKSGTVVFVEKRFWVGPCFRWHQGIHKIMKRGQVKQKCTVQWRLFTFGEMYFSHVVWMHREKRRPESNYWWRWG